MGGDGVVDVDGALGRAGGAAGEVQQGHVLGLGVCDLPDGVSLGQEFGQVQGFRFGAAVGVHQQDVAEVGQGVPDRRHLPAVQRPGGQQYPAGPEVQPLPNRFGAES